MQFESVNIMLDFCMEYPNEYLTMQSHNALHFHVQFYEQNIFNKDFQHIFFSII